MKITLALMLIALAGMSANATVTVSLRDDRVVASGHLIPEDQETTLPSCVIRLRNGSSGKILLIKSKKNEDYRVFGRTLSLDANGQYLVKGVDGGVVTDVAAGKLDSDKWDAPKSVNVYFSTPKPKPVATPSAIPSPTPQVVDNSVFIENAKVKAITDIATPYSSTSEEGASGSPQLGYSHDSTPQPDNSPSEDPPRPEEGAEAYVYPVESGVEPDYAIQPGDTVEVVFYRAQRATVDMKGDIHLVAARGNAESVIQASGKTSDQIAKLAASSGLDFSVLQDPAIRVKVVQFAESAAIVIGAVRNPGRIKIDTDGNPTVRDLIQEAGGLSIPERSAVALVRRGEKVIKLDFGKSDPCVIAKFEILPGDILTITKRKES